MLQKLLDHTDTTFGPGFIILGNTVYNIGQRDDSILLPELCPRPETRCYVLRAWREFLGDRVAITVPVWFGMVGPEKLVLFTDTKHNLTDALGHPLEGVYYHGRDSRICNRLLPSTLIDWNKTYE